MTERQEAATPPPFSLASLVRDYPDFPRRGTVFKDISPLLMNPDGLRQAITEMAGQTRRPDAIVAVESRGFVFGTALALHWSVPLVPARKFGKLPGPTLREVYSLEYGEDTLELQAGALREGQAVVIVDDLLATGGTAAATARLVERTGASVQQCLFLVELVGLGGREKLAAYPMSSLLRFAVEK